MQAWIYNFSNKMFMKSNLINRNLFMYIHKFYFTNDSKKLGIKNNYISKYVLSISIIILFAYGLYLAHNTIVVVAYFFFRMYHTIDDDMSLTQQIYTYNFTDYEFDFKFVGLLDDEYTNYINNIFYLIGNRGYEIPIYSPKVKSQALIIFKEYLKTIKETEDILYINGKAPFTERFYIPISTFEEPTREEINIVTSGGVGKLLVPHKSQYLTQAEIYLRLQNTALKRFLRGINIFSHIKTLIWIYNPLDWEGWFWIIVSTTLVGATLVVGYHNIFIEETTNAFPEPHIKTEEEIREEIYFEACSQLGEDGKMDPILYVEFRKHFIPEKVGDPNNIPREEPITIVEVPKDLYQEIKKRLWPKPPKKVQFSKILDITYYNSQYPVNVHGITAKELRLYAKEDCNIQ